MGVWKDCGWMTRLGTCFYNRKAEAERLARLSQRFPTVLLAGPRNVGKSELATYTLVRVMKVNPLIIDARRGVAKSLVGDRLEPLEKRVAQAILRVLAEKAGLAPLIDAIRSAYEHIRFDRYVLVDEVHLVARDAVRELEAVAKMLRFYPEYRGWRLIVTTSEGVLLSARIADRLDGYGARVVIVEPLGEEDARALYEEYVGTHGCRVEFHAYWGLVGGLPGYLPDLCSMAEAELLDWIERRATLLVQAVLEAAEAAGLEARQACMDAYELLVEKRPIRKPSDPSLARTLTRRNIAYPKGLQLQPQLNVYRAILAAWARSGCLEPPEPRNVLREALHS